MKKWTYILSALLTLCIACEVDITVDLPQADLMYVVEGHIESNQSPTWPYVLVSKNASYFEALDVSTLNDLFIHDAIVTIDDTLPLYELCMEDVNAMPDGIRDTVLALFAGFLNTTPENLSLLDYCVWIPINYEDEAQMLAIFFGLYEPFLIKFNEDYKLEVKIDTHVMTAYTTIKDTVRFDSVWVALENDTLISLRAKLTDPPEMGNNYRILFKRTAGDNVFESARNSSFNDKFFNGQVFDFIIDFRTYLPNDTIIIQLSTIDAEHRAFWRSYDRSIQTQGNPFSSPSNVSSNIDGGLGIWGAYSTTYDTIIVSDYIP